MNVPNPVPFSTSGVLAETKATALLAYFAPDDVFYECAKPYLLRVTDETYNVAPRVRYYAIVDRLDAVLGCDNWRVAYENPGDGSFTRCVLSVRFSPDGDWVTRAGASTDDSPEIAHAESLRSAVLDIGIGRYLANVSIPVVWGGKEWKVPPKLSQHILPEAFRECGRERAREIRDLLTSAISEAEKQNVRVVYEEALRELVRRNGGDPEGRILANNGVYLSRVENRHADAILHGVKLWIEDVAKGKADGVFAPILRGDGAKDKTGPGEKKEEKKSAPETQQNKAAAPSA